MKLKLSFVTNSSSAGFIISCNAIPRSIEEAKQIWFGDKDVSDISDDVMLFLYTNMNEYKIDLNKVLELAKTKKWKNINYTKTNEHCFLSEIASEFEYKEEYYHNDEVCSIERKNPFQEYMAGEYEKLGVDEYDLSWNKKLQLQNKWYTKREVRSRFILLVESIVERLNKQQVQMQIEVGDETEFTGNIEHDFDWNLFPGHVIFSHH
jgi:hypothetical protein